MCRKTKGGSVDDFSDVELLKCGAHHIPVKKAIIENIPHHDIARIGKIINDVLKSKGISYARFARMINCHRTTIYNIVNSNSIDVERLVRISKALDHDFLQYYYPKNIDQLTINLPDEQIARLRDCEITSVSIEIKTRNKKG